MMKTTSSLLVSFCLLLIQDVKETQGRYLEQNENNNGNYNGNNNNNNGFQYEQYKNDLSYKWGNASAQVGEDLDGMWHTTPSEWGDEYWEVLIGIIGVALAATFCFMLICCTPCCCSYDDEPRYVATQEEYDARRRMKQPILDQEGRPHGSRTRRVSGSKRGTAADPDVQNSTQHTSTEDPPTSRNDPKKRRRRTLWEETIVVWKDFFRNGLYVPDDTMSHYTREAKEEQRRRRSRSASRRKRSLSRNKRRGEMV
ncbi:unnamed protein product [Cylindrotheca closterium]|uniref:Uncharacterized protein n=1 Tax=Cylindrotheca closterium TaxID=2856 RepID=A0AAD2G5X6_9STRA|nr:unnamed protein product [Cylindrotheca closterium]